MGQLSSGSGDRNHPELVGLAQGTRRFTECVLPENDSLKWGHAMLTIRRAIEARRAERGEDLEGGFSLIELIIVVVILGILVAVAIPIFANIQNQAKINAAKSAAANAATQWASGLATTPQVIKPYTTGDAALTVTGQPVAGDTVESVCATATNATITGGTTSFKAGPGC